MPISKGGSGLALSSLSLRGFRNLEDQDLAFPAVGVALVGANAQGKSNLLEAIHYLECFRSFRQARDSQLVTFGAKLFRLEASLESPGPPRTVAAAYRKTDGRKKVALDGVEQVRLGRAIGHLGAVAFSPDDAALVSGGPGVRRRFLDIVLSLARPGYLEAAQGYRRAVAQRNAALRTGQSDAAVQAWDGALADAGSQIFLQRRAWTEAWSPAFSSYYKSISGRARGSMAYRSGMRLPEKPGETAFAPEDAAEAFREALSRSLDRDRRHGSTQIGPHRDDLRLGTGEKAGGDSIDLHAYASGGQRRTAALALRLVEAGTVREARKGPPVLLLDDVFAELDENRSERVLAALEAEEFGQVVLTAPKESEVRIRRGSLVRWSIEAGRVAA